MNFYEIKNTKTNECFQAIAKNFSTACRENGHKPNHCKCIWKASVENACDPKNYN